MKALIVMATWVCWAIIVTFPAFVRPSTIEETQALRYNTVTFDLGDAETYSSFLTSLRTQMTGSMACQIPVTPTTLVDLKRFVLVDLKTVSQKTVTLAIDVPSAYVVAYRDTFKNKDRANFLAGDLQAIAKKNLFKGADTVRDITFDGSYEELERAAKQCRENIELGITKLGFAIESIYNKEIVGQLEAKFFLIAIQMISEAARFQYIETMVVERGLYGSFKPDPKVISLEKNWSKISKSIHKSAAEKPACITISPALILKNANNAEWKVDKVSVEYNYI